MKHLLLMLVLVVVAYGAWCYSPRAARDRFVHRVARHGLRLGAIVGLLLALVAVSYYVSSTRIL